MTLREAAQSDREAVVELIRAIPELPQWTPEHLAAGAGSAPAALQRRLLVALEGERLVGFVQTSLLSGEAELESMAVDASCRGRGVGRMLLNHATKLAREDGAEVLRLEVRQSNEAARCLYAVAGMSVAGSRRAYYSEPVEDAVLMEIRWSRGTPGG